MLLRAIAGWWVRGQLGEMVGNEALTRPRQDSNAPHNKVCERSCCCWWMPAESSSTHESEAKFTVKNAVCQSLPFAAEGESDCAFGFPSHEWSCSKGQNA